MSRLRLTMPASLPSVSDIRTIGTCSIDTLLSGYTQALRPGVKASFGIAIDTQKLNDVAPAGPAHKVRLPRDQLIRFFYLLANFPSGWCQLHFRGVDEGSKVYSTYTNNSLAFCSSFWSTTTCASDEGRSQTPISIYLLSSLPSRFSCHAAAVAL